MTSEQRKAIEAKIGRSLSAVEIGRGSIDRPQDRSPREQIAAANQQPGAKSRWIDDTLNHDGTKPKRETRTTAFKRLRASQGQRAIDEQAAADQAAKLATDSVNLKMNRLSEQALERARWDDSIPQSRFDNLVAMREAAKVDDRETFQVLNKSHVEYLESVTGKKQQAIDAEIACLNAVKKSLAEDRFEEPLTTPTPDTFSHIRRSNGMMDFVNKADVEIFEYDPRVPNAKELAQDRLAQHQHDTAGTLGEPITLPQ